MKRLAILLTAPLLLGAAKPVLVPDVSARSIEIRYSFNGAQLLLFGAILYPGGRAPTKPLDIAVVVKGPVEPILVREKQKIAGIWMNADSHRFRSAPSFYAIASSRPVRDLVDERTAAIYELGLNRLQRSPTGEIDAKELRRFRSGLVDLNQRDGLYLEAPSTVNVTDQVLYRARLTIPSSVPEGRYVAETLLIRDGRVIVADDGVTVTISKTGFERFITILSQKYSLLYGTLAVVISLLLGWMAGLAFARI